METAAKHEYLDQLKSELLNRIAKNGQYSQNAFADDLGVSKSFLSRVLGGKRLLTEELACQFSQKLQWSPPQSQSFLLSVRLARAKRPSLKKDLLKEYRKLTGEKIEYRQLKEEHFRLISEWYHGAIMSLLNASDFKSDTKWIAKKLGISLLQVEIAIERLIYLGMLEKTNGQLRAKDESVFIDDIPSQAIRKFHRQHLNKALVALESPHAEDRNVSGITLVGNPRKLAYYNEKIDRFMKDLMQEMEEDEQRDGLYHLTVAMMRLDKEVRT